MKKESKKGLSVVVATVLMILLVMTAVGVVFAVVRNIVESETSKAQDCYAVEFGEKVGINEDYTCWNNTNESVYVSISILDAEIDGLLISIESAGNSKGFELTNEIQELEEVRNYPSYTKGVVLPIKNSGKTYMITGFSSQPDSIRIRPKVGDNSCQVTDTVTQIENCNVIVGL
jgi:hypothetical protein